MGAFIKAAPALQTYKDFLRKSTALRIVDSVRQRYNPSDLLAPLIFNALP
jgi:hypothetical protein